MPKISTVFIGSIATAFLLLPIAAEAQSVADILRKVDQSGASVSAKMEISQTITTPSGDTRTFKMMSYSSGGQEKGLTEYLTPAQVRGMKILTLNDRDEIWTDFPKTNRGRKIASSARHRRVQGSDFTYDDMATGKMAKNWKGKVAGTEKIDGVTCYKLHLMPTASGPKSYSRATVWIDKAKNLMLRVVYYDLDGDKLKQLDMSGYKKIKGIQIPMQYTMINLMDGGTTVMKVLKVAINVQLDPGLFTESGLSQ